MKKYAIGIDLGGTSVKYALIDNEGVFHFQGKLPSKADVSAEAVIGQLVTACKEAMASALQLGVAVEGIGIGTPGIVDETNRIVLGGAENIKGWENLNLADRIEAETGLPVQMGNDANLMGLGETMYGAGQGAQNVVFLTVGTGIGGAVVIGGKLFNGFANPRHRTRPCAPHRQRRTPAHAALWAVWNITPPLPHWCAVSVSVPQKRASRFRAKKSTESLSYASTKKETSWQRSAWTSIAISWDTASPDSSTSSARNAS